jgi:hypothetical protein
MSTSVLSPCAPLTDTETRAALRAVGRVLDQAADAAPPAAVAAALHAARTLPDLLSSPDDFRDSFRPALERLARRHRRFSPALDEFDEATDRHPHLWRDCGEAD